MTVGTLSQEMLSQLCHLTYNCELTRGGHFREEAQGTPPGIPGPQVTAGKLSSGLPSPGLSGDVSIFQ